MVLIRHAKTRPDPSRDSARWELADAAPAACAQLAAALRPLRLTHLVTSEEPKAQATGRLLAEQLSLPWTSAPGLEEHHRRGTPFMVEAAWQRAMVRFFAEPEVRVLGQESAAEARRRFEAALGAVLSRHPHDRLGVVSHGTVMALFVAAHNDLDAYALWRTLRMPDAVRLALPTFTLLEHLQHGADRHHTDRHHDAPDVR